ncbi:MAG: alpha/beta hydrolase [Saprospiraceae bacterium]|nr:alpha/beta hydrolase [Saprospiraceae bacterium]
MKKKLLLLHGALGSQKQFDYIRTELEKHFEVYSLDFEGHANHVSEAAFSIELFSKNVLAFLDEKGIDKISIFGYSMGGYVALKTALTAPNRIEKIVTLATKFNWTLESAEQEVKMLNPDKIEAKVPHFAQKLAAEQAPQDWKTVMHKTADMMLAMGAGTRLELANLKQIQTSVIIGIGDLDKMVSYEESEQVAQALPNAQLINLKGIKHPIDRVPSDVLLNYIQNNFN